MAARLVHLGSKSATASFGDAIEQALCVEVEWADELMPRESSGKSVPCGISQLASRYVIEDWPPEMASAKAARRSRLAGDSGANRL